MKQNKKNLNLKINKEHFNLFIKALKEINKNTEKEKVDDNNDNFKIKIVNYNKKLYILNLNSDSQGENVLGLKDIFLDNIFNFESDYQWFITDPKDFIKFLDNLDEVDEYEFKFEFIIIKEKWVVNYLIISDGNSEIEKDGERDDNIKISPEMIIEKINESNELLKLSFDDKLLKKIKTFIKNDKVDDIIWCLFEEKDITFKGNKWKLKIIENNISERGKFCINKKWINMMDNENNTIRIMKKDDDEGLFYFGLIENNFSRTMFFFEYELED